MNPSEEQIKNRLAATGFTQEQVDTASQTGKTIGTPVNPITSTDMVTTPDPKITQPDPFAVPGISKLETELSSEEQNQANLIDESLKLIEETAGESAFRTEESKRQGVEGLRKTQTDLAGQVNALKRQSEAIQLQKDAVAERMQQASEGRGRTASGLAPLTASEQRAFTLQQADVASRALIVQADLEATQGKLATALDLVDEAANAKFGEANRKLEAMLKNLEIIKNDPRIALADKKRAEATAKRLEAEKAKLENDRTNFKAIKEVAIAAAAKRADSLTLKKINDLLKNPTEENVAEANRLAAPFLKEDKLLSVAEVKALGVPYGTTESGAFGITPQSEGDKDITTKLTSEDRRTLIGVNLTDEMIDNIAEGVRTIGIDEVLKDSYTEAQKNAIRKVYGSKSKEITNNQILEAARAMEHKDVENYFKARYTEAELLDFAKEAGFASFWQSRATELANWLASPKAREKLSEFLRKTYEDQGYAVK